MDGLYIETIPEQIFNNLTLATTKKIYLSIHIPIIIMNYYSGYIITLDIPVIA